MDPDGIALPMKTCPQCAEAVQDAAVLCRHCRYSFVGRKCAECLSDNPAGTQLCGTCGAPLTGNRPLSRRVSRAPVKDYMIESILSLLFCGGLIAIPALIYASQVRSKQSAGDYEGAVEASRNAKKWLTIAVGVACGLLLLCVLLVAVVAALGR